MEKMDDGRLIKEIYVVEGYGSRGRGRLKRRWTEGVKEQIKRKGFESPRKVLGFSSASLFPSRKQEPVTLGVTI